MSKFYSFPHYEINIKDESVTYPLILEQLALHVPMFLSFAECGPINQPVYGNIDDLTSTFGAGTFDVFSQYYKHPNVFLTNALPNQNCFFVRLADTTAETASIVFQCSTWQTPLVQYQKDSTGMRILDTNGNPIPILDSNNDPVTQPGMVLKWTTRPLAANEVPAAITEVTQMEPNPAGGANIEVTTYPIAIFEGSSPGAWGNVTGFTMYWNPLSDTSVATAMQALIYTFSMNTITWGTDTPSVVRDIYLDATDEFTFAQNTTDMNTMRRYYLAEVLSNDYDASVLTFNMYLYPNNVETIGAACIALENVTNFPELTSPYMVNMFTGKTMEQQPYDHIMIDTTDTNSVLMNANVINYMTGGNDGSLADTTLENLTQLWLAGDVFPAIQDRARYPITHLYDSGYQSKTKESMITFLGILDDIKVIMSTQSVYDNPNTMAEDQSMGSFLRSLALLLPESMMFGTGACRCTIFQQCGVLNQVTPYTGIIPMTLDCMIKKGIWQGSPVMKGKPKGLPNSAVTTVKNINWFPVTDDFKQLSWDNALNYCQYYDMTDFHYPDVISVYSYLTSLLSDDIFLDMLIYIKHIVRVQWAIFAGCEDPIPQLIGRIKDSVGAAIYAALGNFVTAVVNPYQTAEDVVLGYSLTIEIDVYGTMPNRVWNVIIPVRRAVVPTTTTS